MILPFLCFKSSSFVVPSFIGSMVGVRRGFAPFWAYRVFLKLFSFAAETTAFKKFFLKKVQAEAF
jgi:hypothetical protein